MAEETPAMTIERLERALVQTFAVPGPSFGPTPTRCPFCGSLWRGMADAGRYTACCGVFRSDALRWLGTP